MVAIIDYRGKSPTKTTSGVPLITAKVVKGGRVLDQDHEFIALEDFDGWMRRGLPEVGDVVVTTEAPLGEVAQLTDARVALAQRIILLRPNPDLLNKTFLRYAMQSAGVQQQLSARATGTTVLGIRQSELRLVTLPLPPLFEQEAIAEVLGSIDDKIDVNNRMNRALHSMVHALFRSWFVDFDPVRANAEQRVPDGMDPETTRLFPSAFEDSAHAVPKGWRVGKVSDACVLNVQQLSAADSLPEVEYVEISGVVRGDVLERTRYLRGKEPSRARRRVSHGDSVLSTVRPDRGSFFLALNPPDDLVVSTGFAVLSPRALPWSFLFVALTRMEVSRTLGQLADGGAYPAVRPEVIAGLDMILPPAATAERFHAVAGPILETMETNRRENLTLTALRDSLLPKLLCGELRLCQVDAAAIAASA